MGEQADVPGLGVHLSHRHVGPEREAGLLLDPDVLCVQPRICVGRQPCRVGGQHGDLGERPAGVGHAGDADPAVVELDDVVDGRLGLVGDDRPRLLQHGMPGPQEGGAGHLHRTRPHGSSAADDHVGVALDERHVLERHLQDVGHDLAERRLVAVTV